MNYKTDTKKGLYTLQFPEKYISAVPPVYKSGWEWRIFDKMDRTPHILKWGYECIDIYYNHPFKSGFTVYKPDIFCILIDASGYERKYLIEIKPHKMAVKPVPPAVPKSLTAQNGIRYKRAMQKYQQAVMDFAVNEAKWRAAEVWCATHAVRWVVLTEENSSGVLG